MKILISSHAFAPSIGGIETVGQLLGEEFVRSGEEVMVLTQTPGDGADNFPWQVIRQPSLGQLFRAIRWCDVFWQNNLSLRTVWPAWVLHKPVVITHHGSYCRRPAGIDLLQRIKHAVVAGTPGVAPSRAIADCFRTESSIIPDPYDVRVFNDSVSPAGERPDELIFLGRLVAEKGVDLLLEALGRLRAEGIFPRLTIVGAGPEEAKLHEISGRLGLREQVSFVGSKRGPELAALLRRHKILVVPSRYDEPFGVVALEGIACGCVVVGSSGGGLPEAIGPCGLTFPNGDSAALGRTLERLLRQPEEQERLLANAAAHLGRFSTATIARSYLNLFRSKLA